MKGANRLFECGSLRSGFRLIYSFTDGSGDGDKLPLATSFLSSGSGGVLLYAGGGRCLFSVSARRLVRLRDPVGRRVACVTGSAGGRCFLTSDRGVCYTGLGRNQLRAVGRPRLSGFRVIGCVCFRPRARVLMVNALLSNVCLCGVRDHRLVSMRGKLRSVGIGSVVTDGRGRGRILVTAGKTNMCGLGLNACRLAGFLGTSRGRSGGVGNGVVGSVCVSSSRGL